MALAERERPESERKQGRDDKRRQTIAYDEEGETGPRNGDHLRQAPVTAAAGPVARCKAAAAQPTVPTPVTSTVEECGRTADLQPIDTFPIRFFRKLN